VKSNCLSVQPVQTEYGRKTQINQSSCNLDTTCVKGDCPAFVLVTPGTSAHRTVRAPEKLPTPVSRFAADGFTMRITGVGGTGVVTVAQILAVAAVMQDLRVRALDQTGLAQKGGAVVSDLTFGDVVDRRSPKIASGQCDLYLGCDALVASDTTYLTTADPGRTLAVVSSSEVPTGAMVIDTAANYPSHSQVTAALAPAVRDLVFVDANGTARVDLGDEQFANLVTVGVAFQSGGLPLAAEAIEAAIRLNGVAVEANLAAFRHGRAIAAGLETEPDPAPDTMTLDELIMARGTELAEYQDERYADRYRHVVTAARSTGSAEFATAVARNLFKLMAYKDEYEVARLSMDAEFTNRIAAEFGSDAKFSYQLHPPVLRALGMRSKLSLGPWFRPALRSLVAMRRLRGTAFDPFGHFEVRRVERALVDEYAHVIGSIVERFDVIDTDIAVRIAELPDIVRGYEAIKLASVERYHRGLAELLTELDCGSGLLSPDPVTHRSAATNRSAAE
jgi:indolepyruvate ferredoxin oxidoreductase